jgi:hypothetical protein
MKNKSFTGTSIIKLARNFIRWIILCLLLLMSFLAVFREYIAFDLPEKSILWKAPEPLMNVQCFQDHLQGIQIAGYLFDIEGYRKPTSAEIRDYYLTQYTSAPTIIDHLRSYEYYVVNSRDEDRIKETINQKQYQVIKDCGNGFLLIRDPQYR